VNLPAQAPFAYALAFLAWGAASGQWVPAIFAMIFLEFPRLTGRTVEMEERFFRAGWLLSLFIEWILAINAWLEPNRVVAIRGLLLWTPFAALPLVFVSAVAKKPGVPVSALLLLLHRYYHRPTSGGVVLPVPRIDPFFPMICLVLLAASYQGAGDWFFAVACVIIGWIFISNRKENRRALPLSLLVAVGLAFLLQWGILHAYGWIEQALLHGARRASNMETSRTMTRIGTIEEIKNSGTVKWQVTIPPGVQIERMPEATYNYFRRNMWINTGYRQFEDLDHEGDDPPHDKWVIHEAAVGAFDPVEVRGRADPDYSVLPLIPGVARFDRLPSFVVQRNGLGVVRSESARPVLDFEMRRTPRMRAGTPPGEHDLDIPEDLHEVTRAIVEDLGLLRMSSEQAVETVHRFFASEFRYTRQLRGLSVAGFLESGREGHCEYFATGGAMLLRAAGIPARYHTGFAVQEYDGRSGSWLLRGIHAHAWNSAWINGSWQEVDFTPSDWLAADRRQLTFWQPLADWWERVSMAFLQWRASNELSERGRIFAPIGIALAVLYTAVRLWMGRRKRRAEESKTIRNEPVYGGGGVRSDWLELLPGLESRFGARPRWLPPLSWVDSWGEEAPAAVRDAARGLVRSHYLLRFAPENDEGGEPDAGQEAVSSLREFLRQSPTAALVQGGSSG